MKKNQLNQFDSFHEFRCPNCGEKIEQEILINILENYKKQKK